MTDIPLNPPAGHPDTGELQLSVVTPPGWWDLPLDPGTRHRDIADLVDERLPAGDSSDRRRLIDMLEGAAATAEAAGAVLASQFGVVGAELRFAASMMVAVRRVANPEGLSLAERVSALSSQPSDKVVDRQVAVEAIELPGVGEVQRRRCRRLVELGPDTGVDFVCVEYFAPVPRSPAIAIATFTSPTIAASDELLAIFDGIASTLEMRRSPRAGH